MNFQFFCVQIRTFIGILHVALHLFLPNYIHGISNRISVVRLKWRVTLHVWKCNLTELEFYYTAAVEGFSFHLYSLMGQVSREIVSADVTRHYRVFLFPL